jgi:two-component system chemotaxis response regulator CheB
MVTLRLIISTSNPLTAARLARDLAALPEVDVRGRAADLSAAYMLAEQHEPHLALVGRDHFLHPDFEGLVSLFRMLGTTAVQIGDTPADGALIAPGMAAPALRERLAGLRAATDSAAPAAIAQGRAPVGSGGAALPGQRWRGDRIILIGASTGGIDALLRILADLPPDGPPVIIVQHTGNAFSGSLIRLFARCTRAQVLPAQNGLRLSPGMVVVGAGCGGHVTLAPGVRPVVLVTPGQPVSGHTPSVDVLFRSALPMAPQVVAALLTGMGRDGARGLLDLRSQGARTLAQDEASSVVYGMPRAAAELGAVERVVPLSRMAVELLQSCRDPVVEGLRK